MGDEKVIVIDEQQKSVEVIREVPMGFEDESQGDLIIPRVKVIQALSPERKEKLCAEGEIINSLTLDKLNGRVFIPVFKFNNNIEWKPRADGGGILCIARDGKVGTHSDGTTKLCAACKRNEFDNTKTGKESVPKCNKYFDFFGFMAGERIPLVLSFAKTNYSEGKKLYSLAKVTMQNMWNFGYTLNEKLVAKGGNEWYIINIAAAGPSTQEDRDYALSVYKMFRANDFKFDMDSGNDEVSTEPVVDTAAAANAEF